MNQGKGQHGGARAAGGSLHRRAAWLIWSGLINLANSVVLWMVVARWREAEELGRFTVVMGVYLIFVALCSLGLGPVVVSEYARRSGAARGGGEESGGERSTRGSDPSPAGFVASAAALLLACSAAFVALMCAAGFAASAAGEARLTTVVMSLALPPTALLVVAEAVFTATGRTRVVALAATVENVIRTLVPLGLVVAGCGLPVIGLSFVGARLAACLVYAAASRDELKGRRGARALGAASWVEVRRIAALAPTFAGITILSSLHWQLAAILLGRLGGEVEAAQYGVASRFLAPTAVLLAGYANVVLPEVARLTAVSGRAAGEFLSRGLRLVIALGLPCAVGAWLLARDALELLFGAQYGAAAGAMSILAASVVPLGAALIVSRGLIAAGRQRVDLAANAAAVVTSSAASWLLIPRYGAAGAAAAHLLSMLVLAAVEFVYVSRRLFRLEVKGVLAACAAPLAVMALAVWQTRAWGVLGAVAVGGSVYLIGLWLMRRGPKTNLRFEI
jgi:O-antigen/teichoic acid export membrane protein